METIKIDLQIALEDSRWETVVPSSIESFLETYIVATLNHADVRSCLPRYVEVSVVLTNDVEIKPLNLKYRGKNQPTNVLSFPQETDVAAMKHLNTCVLLGDIVLSIETIQLEAQQQQKLMHHHLAHLITHGTLHLIGYDHEVAEAAKEMESLEVNILRQYDIPNPYEFDTAHRI